MVEGEAGNQLVWIGILEGCVASGSLLSPFDPRFLHLQNRNHKHTHLTRLKITEMMCEGLRPAPGRGEAQ